MTPGSGSIARIGLVAGPLAAAAIAFGLGPDPARHLSPAGSVALALGAWMAIWWMTEAVPLAATALLPIVVLPLGGVAPVGVAATGYASPTVFLFLGGFVLGLAVERCGLHRRLALATLVHAGTSPHRLVGGFMLVTGVMSMWLSNTATAMMMMPIAGSVLATYRDELARTTLPPAAVAGVVAAFGAALMLGVAYAASIGGMGTPIGTPPNLVMSGFLRQHYGIELTVLQWMQVGVPVAALLLPIAWLWLTRVAFPLAREPLPRDALAAARAAAGPMTRAEMRVAAVFVLVAAGWMLRPQIARATGIATLDDATIAIAGALVLFLLPSGEPGRRLMDWATARTLPWEVLILFGGGLAIAQAIASTGADRYLAALVAGTPALPLPVLLLALGVLVTFSGELTSNTAAATTLMPILAAWCAASGLDPLPVFFTATLTGSLGFMLPVATPPNAIAYGTGVIPAQAMLRAGFGMNLLGIVVIVAWVHLTQH